MGDSVCWRLGIHCEKLGTSEVLARARVARGAPAMRKAKGCPLPEEPCQLHEEEAASSLSFISQLEACGGYAPLIKETGAL